MKTVSVVVPTHERSSALQRAIDSIIKQTFSDFEIIIIDDASTDCTKEVVNEYDDSRIRYIRHDENRGGSAARNTGINAAEGELIAFLDDDDEWKVDKLAAQLDAYERTTADTGVIYTGIKNTDSDGKINSIKTPQIEGDVTKELLLHNFIGSFSAIMVDRETIEQTGLLDERFPSWQDWEYYIRLSQEARFAAVSEPLVVRHNAAHEQISDDFEIKLTKTYPLLRDRFDALSAEYGRGFQRRREGHLLFHVGYAALSQGRYALARRLLSRSLLRAPTNKEGYIYWLSSLGGKYTYQPVQAAKRWAIRQLS